MNIREDPDSLRMRQFGELLAECRYDLFVFIYSLVQNHADAEDVFQQAAIVLWQKFDTFELGTNFNAWATKVAHNTARDYIRTRRRNAITLSDEVLDAIAAAYTSQRQWATTDASAALRRCLKKLSDKERNLVERCYSADRDFESIAQEENRTIGAIYQAICRVRKKLYACVQRTLSQEANP